MGWVEDNNFDGYETYYEPDELEDDEWLTREGKAIKIADMTNQHLYNAFNLTGNERLQREMVLRLYARIFGGAL
jgi:hypothetical protein